MTRLHSPVLFSLAFGNEGSEITGEEEITDTHWDRQGKGGRKAQKTAPGKTGLVTPAETED